MIENPRIADAEERLLILAPTRRDARLTCDILQRSGIESLPCTDLKELCRYLREGAGGALITEEAFASDESTLLLNALAKQPPWSDLPVIFLMRQGDYTPLAQRAMESLGNIILLERPIRRAMLVSAARAALRERRRQYTVRYQLQELNRRRAALEKQEKALTRSKREAEEANQAKSEFLANMSHEIRTPMTGFMSALEYLQDGETDPERRRILGMADKSAKRLRALIDDVLDFSRIEARKVEIRQEPFDLHSFIDDIAEVFTLSAREKNLKFATEIAVDPPLILLGDPDRLGQVLINLVGNAFKFTHQGTIRLSVRARNGCLEFSVSDTGIGIPEEKFGMLFENFSQVDSSFTRRYEGTGLGLAISKGLVELMGGEISIRSREGEGSVFSFSIPLITAEENPSASSLSTGEPRCAPAFRILLAEDEPMIREMISIVLRKRGLQPVTAESGREALKKWEEGAFDLIFMDLQMPEMDGIEATEAIRKKAAEGAVSPRIIGLTAHASSEVRQKCLEAGMDDVLVKPLQMEALFSAIDNCSR